MKKLIAFILGAYALYTIIEWLFSFGEYEISIWNSISVIVLSAIILYPIFRNNDYYDKNYYKGNHIIYWDNRQQEEKEISKKIVKNYKTNCKINL